MDEEPYFTEEGNGWQQKNYYETKYHLAPKQAIKTKFPAKD
jgi:hypothetical protein